MHLYVLALRSVWFGATDTPLFSSIKTGLTSQNHGKDKIMQRPWHKLRAHTVRDIKVLDLALKRMTQKASFHGLQSQSLSQIPYCLLFFSRYQLRRGQEDNGGGQTRTCVGEA